MVLKDVLLDCSLGSVGSLSDVPGGYTLMGCDGGVFGRGFALRVQQICDCAWIDGGFSPLEGLFGPSSTDSDATLPAFAQLSSNPCHINYLTGHALSPICCTRKGRRRVLQWAWLLVKGQARLSAVPRGRETPRGFGDLPRARGGRPGRAGFLAARRRFGRLPRRLPAPLSPRPRCTARG